MIIAKVGFLAFMDKAAELGAPRLMAPMAVAPAAVAL